MTIKDQMDNWLEFPKTPQRAISLVPSITQLLADLHLEKEVVGITKFCIQPPSWYQSKIRVGGTKTIHLEKIDQINPDFIIANKEENDQNQIQQLRKNYRVYISDIITIEHMYQMIMDVGLIMHRSDIARSVVETLRQNIKNIRRSFSMKRRAIYMIWNDPLMVAGQNTFIHTMLDVFGFQNAMVQYRYPAISLATLSELDFDYMLLSSEPFPFNEKHLQYFQKKFPTKEIQLVDGTLFSWFGSRLIHLKTPFSKHIK